MEWGVGERGPQRHPDTQQHKALTRLAVLPYIAHRACARVAPAKVFAGSAILTGAKEAGGGHYKKSRAKSDCCRGGRGQRSEQPPSLSSRVQGRVKASAQSKQQGSIAAAMAVFSGSSPSTSQHWQTLLTHTNLAVPASIAQGTVALVFANVVETGAPVLAGP